MIALASKTAIVRVSCRLRLFPSMVSKTELGVALVQPTVTCWHSDFWLAFSWTMRCAFAIAAIAKVFFGSGAHQG